ncbi:MAG: 16S rRNA (cytidine(1402)-2'-O)-methyltransferase [Myxococcota bacterium]
MSTLFVVATPLGNLEDMTPRAQRILREADVVYAEDTRRTLSLLQHFGSARELLSLHEHNETARIERIVRELGEGRSVAIVSDAGTPGVSDPGERVVAAVKAAGFSVSPVPGPSALAAAMSVAGFPMGASLFAGFIPHKGRERNDALAQVLAHRGSVVFFESPHRAAKTLGALAEAQPERRACVAREISKLHEEVRDGSLAELAEWSADRVRGELTVVLGPWTPVTSQEDQEIDAALTQCLDAGLSTRDAASAVAVLLKVSRREVYRRAQRLQPPS